MPYGQPFRVELASCVVPELRSSGARWGWVKRSGVEGMPWLGLLFITNESIFQNPWRIAVSSTRTMLAKQGDKMVGVHAGNVQCDCPSPTTSPFPRNSKSMARMQKVDGESLCPAASPGSSTTAAQWRSSVK